MHFFWIEQSIIEESLGGNIHNGLPQGTSRVSGVRLASRPRHCVCFNVQGVLHVCPSLNHSTMFDSLPRHVTVHSAHWTQRDGEYQRGSQFTHSISCETFMPFSSDDQHNVICTASQLENIQKPKVFNLFFSHTRVSCRHSLQLIMHQYTNRTNDGGYWAATGRIAFAGLCGPQKPVSHMERHNKR